MIKTVRLGKQDAIILVAPGFEETWLANCVTSLRQRGYRALMVSLAPELIEGANGMTVKPDSYLSKLLQTNRPPKLLAIADGKTCVNQLLSEPNVYRLMNQTVAAGGRIAATTESETILRHVGRVKFSDFDNCIWQRSTPTSEYAEQLVASLSM